MPKPLNRTAALHAAIDEAAAAKITPAKMVQLLDHAIALSIAQGNGVVEYSIAGKTVKRSLEVCQRLRAYYASLGANGATIVRQQAEFKAG